MGQARKANPDVIEVHLKSGSAQIADNRRVGFRFIDVAKVRRFQNLNRDIATVDAARLTPQIRRLINSGCASSSGKALNAMLMSGKPSRDRRRFSFSAAVIDKRSRSPISPRSLARGRK